MENKIQDVTMDYFKFEVSVLVRKPNEIRRILNRCPFSEIKKENSYFSILHGTPNAELVRATEIIQYPDEDFDITNHWVYFYSSAGTAGQMQQ